MEEPSIPSLSSGAVGSRFISQADLESAKARREEQWKAAYARLGQEPPPQQQEDTYDGRSLAEKLAANKIAKQEEWEEKMKLANQFRALEEDEIMFLDSIRERQEAEERLRKQQEGEELKNFKEAVAARTNAMNNSSILSNSTAKSSTSKSISVPRNVKKDVKKSLKGVIVKKRPKPTSQATKATEGASLPEPPSRAESQPDSKRRKVT